MINAETGNDEKPRILVVDDEQSMLDLLRMRLGASYEVLTTSNAEQAIGIALEYKPGAILMDLAMPKLSGFELCQGLRSLTYTASIPIFVITGTSDERIVKYCEELGVKAIFQKPIDFASLSEALRLAIENRQAERRQHVRIKMKIPLMLRGTDKDGHQFDEQTLTENVSRGGFFCACSAPLFRGATVEVFMVTPTGLTYVGGARVVRLSDDERSGSGFKFTEKTAYWIVD